MDDSILNDYILMYQLQSSKIKLLEKQIEMDKATIKSLDDVIEVQNRLINLQEQKIRQITGPHLKVVK